MPESLNRKFFKDVFLDVLVVVLMVLVIRQFFFAPFKVSGPSMCDTFNFYNDRCYSGEGEFIITSRFPTWNIFGFRPAKIERGDVVVFRAPYTEKKEFFIKRVIGLPGETIRLVNGEVVVVSPEGDEMVLDEPYLNEQNQENTQSHRSHLADFEVPEGHFFVLGDNRIQSSDSRRCFRNLGCENEFSPFLESSAIQGEVKLVLFPIKHFRLVKGVRY